MWKEPSIKWSRAGRAAPVGRPPLSYLAALLPLVCGLMFQNGCFSSSQGAHSRKGRKRIWQMACMLSLKKLPRNCCLALPLTSHLSKLRPGNPSGYKETGICSLYCEQPYSQLTTGFHYWSNRRVQIWRKHQGKIWFDRWPNTEVKRGEEPKRPSVFRLLLMRERVFSALSRDKVDSKRRNRLGERNAGKLVTMTRIMVWINYEQKSNHRL